MRIHAISNLSLALMSTLLGLSFGLRAQSDSVESLRHEIDDLRREIQNDPKTYLKTASFDPIEQPLAESVVLTKSGNLRIGGLVQFWYYTFQHDRNGLYADTKNQTVFDTNTAQDIGGFRIRRAELTANMDIHENISAYMMIDPAREAGSFPLVTDNQATQSIFKRTTQVSPEFLAQGLADPVGGSTSSIAAVRSGAGNINTLLQDAYINVHNLIPHHDFQMGQFRPWLGHDGLGSDAKLDFVERSFIGLLTENRDIGASVHGSWFCDRLQYWAGVFNGAGNYYLSSGPFTNRSDDNSSKDFNAQILLRPLWESPRFGSLEIGYATEMGTHGSTVSTDLTLNGLDRKKVFASRNVLFGSYSPGWCLKGLWMRGEFMRVNDRNAPGSETDLLLGQAQDIGNTGIKPFASVGYFLSAGYRFRDSAWSSSLPCYLNDLELAVRFDNFENVQVVDLDPDGAHENGQNDKFHTKVTTLGVNYYLPKLNTKIQANYNIVNNPSATVIQGFDFHKVKNNSFVINLQIDF